MARVRTSGKGAVVIPQSVRTAVGLKPGQFVEVTAGEAGRIVIVPLAEDPIAALEGILKGKPGTVAEFLKERKDEERRRERRL